ncbi:MAG: hypothetical protein WD969_16035 [Paracoccaceae bacterium]
MEYEHAISGLLHKRDEIAKRIDALRVEGARLTNDMRAIERALHAFGVQGIPQPPRAYQYTFERHELRRFILAHFRQHGTATTRAITESIFAAKGLDPDDRKHRKDVQSTITRALIHMADRGLVERTGSPRGYVWRLVG